MRRNQKTRGYRLKLFLVLAGLFLILASFVFPGSTVLICGEAKAASSSSLANGSLADRTMLASNRLSLTASVTVVASAVESYASKVVKYSKVINPSAATGKPNLLSATMRYGGSIDLQLQVNVPTSSTISVWVSGNRLPLVLDVYVSQNGKKWYYAGRCSLTQTSYYRHDLSAQFSNVKYVRLVRKDSNKTGQLGLDAVLVKGR